MFFDATELEVHALAPAPNGGLYVGTSPDGRVYKVDAKGQAAPFFDPEDKYIWSLAAGRDGTLYAGTGEKGVIYKVTPDGKGAVFYRTQVDARLAACCSTGPGDLIAGTESPGTVFRINKDGTGFLILDSDLQEVSALRPGPNGACLCRGAERESPADERPSSRAAGAGDELDPRALGDHRDHVAWRSSTSPAT